MKYLISFLMALVLTKVQAQYPAVTIPGSEVRKITSKIVAGQEYELHIMLPGGYKAAVKKYPVVYLMDSQWDFPLVSDTMVAHKYPSVRLQSKILENTGHGGTKNETYARGLQYVFERPKLNLAARVLNSYAGTYQLPDGRTMQLKNENGQLALYFGGNRIFTLYAASEKDFYATAQFLNIHFENEPGKPQGFWLETYCDKQFVKKTN
jgi:Domain of unknown function (DUF3471)